MITCQFEDGGHTSLRHVVVDVLVIKDNRILLVKRAPHLSNGGKYGVIGGYVERDETLQQAVFREVREETGYDIEIIRQLSIIDKPNRPQDDRQNIAFVYLAKPITKTGKPDNESTEVKWHNLDDLPPSKLFAFDHYEIIQKYLVNQG